ncbi:MAG: hypothetical protein BWY57_00819 [Betaproteobacteria bacterium ADurb.Bin341]|nr:MAG: hypothetical protein BWY57_00819 [Betaproteobacteria bacterium ADurb.Bin341]
MNCITISRRAAQACLLHHMAEQESQTIKRLADEYRIKRQELEALAHRITACAKARTQYLAALRNFVQ